MQSKLSSDSSLQSYYPRNYHALCRAVPLTISSSLILDLRCVQDKSSLFFSHGRRKHWRDNLDLIFPTWHMLLHPSYQRFSYCIFLNRLDQSSCTFQSVEKYRVIQGADWFVSMVVKCRMLFAIGPVDLRRDLWI